MAAIDRAAIAAQARAARNEAIARIVANQKDRKPLESLPGRTWAAMSLKTRTVLVMLASSTAGNARDLAARQWEQLTEQDRESIAACARELGRDLAGAASLY